MAILLVKVPPDIARCLSDISVPGDAENEGDFHITLVYFEEMDDETTFKAARVIYGALKQCFAPIQIGVNTVGSFPADPETGITPIIAKVTSPSLSSLRAKIVEALDENNVPYSRKFPDFKPHVTLSYSQTPFPTEQRIPSLQWGCAEISFWGGKWGDHSLSICYPLQLPPQDVSEKEVYRTALSSVFSGNLLPALSTS